MNAKDPAGAAKLVVDGSEVNLFDAQLPQEGRAHDTWLDGDVERTLA